MLEYQPAPFWKKIRPAAHRQQTFFLCYSEIFFIYRELRQWLFGPNQRTKESTTAWKVSKYGVFSGPYFPVFGLNTGKYGPEKTPYLDTFYTVYMNGIVWVKRFAKWYLIKSFHKWNMKPFLESNAIISFTLEVQ